VQMFGEKYKAQSQALQIAAGSNIAFSVLLLSSLVTVAVCPQLSPTISPSGA
jgi:hypothetical protein